MVPRPERGTAGPTVGERGIAVGGDVINSVIVTGDNADVKLVLGSLDGALLERLARSERPSKRLRAEPLRNIPAELADRVDREPEARAIAESVTGSPVAVNVHGEEGIGKTYALLRALNADDSPIPPQAVYVHGAGQLEDVLQSVFEAFYECIPLFKSPAADLRRDLAGVSAIVVLDSVDVRREAAQQLVLALTGCRVVVVSRHRVIWEGTPLLLRGLELRFAVTIVEHELGRPLAPGERESAERICTTLFGHPLRIREAVAAANETGRSLTEIASAMPGENAPSALAAAKLTEMDGDTRRVMEALAVFADSPIGREHLRALINSPNPDELIEGALRSRDLRARSPRYSLGMIAGEAARSLDLSAAGDQALAHFVSWAHATRNQPELQLAEGPALLALLRWAVDNGRLHEAVELGRAIDPAFAFGRRFGAWGELLEMVLSAARASGDRGAEAWALHQLGTRAVALGDLATGAELLTRALTLRRELGDSTGATATADNLAVARRLGWSPKRIWSHPFLLTLAVALLAAGAVIATVALAGSNRRPLQVNTVRVVSPGDQRSAVKSRVSLQIRASDSAAGPGLTYGATGLPVGLSIDSSTGLITGFPSQPGTSSVTVTATDATGAAASKRFSWTVTGGTVADIVTVVSPGDQRSAVKSRVSLQIRASDSGGAGLTYGATGLPVGLSIDSSTGLITGSSRHPGTSSVTVTATDATGAAGTQSFSWTVTGGTVADIVTVVSPGSQRNAIKSSVSLQIMASDSGGAGLTYGATGLPVGLSIDSSTGLITGFPSQPGSFSVTVTATDATGASDSQSFTWTVG